MSTLGKRNSPSAKNATSERIAGRPEPVVLLTTAKIGGPDTAENFENTE